MTFYEQELRKIVGERYPDATYVGRACYVRLSDMNRAKIQFVMNSSLIIPKLLPLHRLKKLKLEKN